MNVVAIVQARMGSLRFPAKVLKPLGEYTTISLLLARLSLSQCVSRIIVATTNQPEDNILADYISELGYSVYRGDRDDVLSRYYAVATESDADVVVRITGDCPLVDPHLVDNVIQLLTSRNSDYASNVCPPSFPDGFDVEVMKYSTLKAAYEKASSQNDREHVTKYIQNQPLFKSVNLKREEDRSELRATLDYEADYVLLQNIVSEFAPNIYFTVDDVIKFIDRENSSQSVPKERNEGQYMTSGQKLWTRAKELIPGGSMLLSKRSEMFLPNRWPAYFSKSKGCKVWDLDNKAYYDMSLMGVGTNVLGYGHPEVDDAVRRVISCGNMSTLNAPEEVYLAEKLTEIHPFAKMVRFCRSGGEANSVAVRIARAASGREKIAFCGYHGWHDWYLATNLDGRDGLGENLLPGLNPRGVPRGLENTVVPFRYNDIDHLKDLASNNQLAAIKMEVIRNVEPNNNFLHEVRELANRHKIILIFDECTTGFRQTFGGIHKQYGVEPDIAIFGKTLGNGYAISAIIGNREIMSVAGDTFISSTFWTERIGSAAALKTLEVMERDQSWEQIKKIGSCVRNNWIDIAKKHQLTISVSGIPSLSILNFHSHDALKYKTYISQEMLKKGYLASTAFYASTAHTEKIINGYLECLDDVFKVISLCEAGEIHIDDVLDDEVCHNGFTRLN